MRINNLLSIIWATEVFTGGTSLFFHPSARSVCWGPPRLPSTPWAPPGAPWGPQDPPRASSRAPQDPPDCIAKIALQRLHCKDCKDCMAKMLKICLGSRAGIIFVFMLYFAETGMCPDTSANFFPVAAGNGVFCAWPFPFLRGHCSPFR